MTDINILRDKAHTIAKEKGFWDNPVSTEVMLMLVITELSEAVEAHRKEKIANKIAYDYALEESLDPFDELFKTHIKDTIEDELADAFIRLLDLAGGENIIIRISDVQLSLAEDCAKTESFSEAIYYICTRCLGDFPNRSLGDVINDGITNIWGLCNFMDIDLEWHIKEKMNYNSLREKMHGKAY